MNDSTGMPQSAVVVGGTSEIARAILRSLTSRRLRKVVLGGRDTAALEAAGAELSALGAEEVHALALDVTDIAAHRSFAEEAQRRLGHIDLVLVAAGTLGEQASDESDPMSAALVVETNFTGPAASLVAFSEILRRQGHGRIVVLSSVAGVRVRRANFVYGSSKAGLDGFCLGLADALVGSGASLMLVRPGWVATQMTRGREPGPFATTPEAVAQDVVGGLEHGAGVVWSPRILGPVFAMLKLVPRALWRRIPG